MVGMASMFRWLAWLVRLVCCEEYLDQLLLKAELNVLPQYRQHARVVVGDALVEKSHDVLVRVKLT